MSAEFVEIQVTCGDDGEAMRIAEQLVDRRQAACVQRVPIHSVYRWQDAVERDDEVLLLVKTTSVRVDEVRTTVNELHSYDVPAFTVVQIGSGSEQYLAWIAAATSGD